MRAAARLTCWPSTVCTATSMPSRWPGTRSPGRSVHQRGEQRVLGQRLVHGDRVAVGVEQAAGALRSPGARSRASVSVNVQGT